MFISRKVTPKLRRPYSFFWRKGRFYSFLLPVVGFPLSLLSRVFPKDPQLQVFGSFNGAKIGDNSLALCNFQLRNKAKAFFITKEKLELRQKLADGSSPVYAYSLKGIFFQLRASRAYYTHSVFDFISPLIVGARIVCLQHGYPIKKGGAANRASEFSALFSRPLLGDTSPYVYYYFCHEVWTPPGVFEENTRQVFAHSNPKIVVEVPPRLWGLRASPNKQRILFAPTYSNVTGLEDRLTEWGFFDNNSPLIRSLRKYGLELVFRPHPAEVEQVGDSAMASGVKIDYLTSAEVLVSTSGAVITDASSIGFDSMQLGIPTYFLKKDLQAFQSVEVGIFENVLAIINKRSVSSLEEALLDYVSKS